MPKKSDADHSRGYTQEDLEKAVSAVKPGGLKLREAARTYSVPYTTIQRHRHEDNPNFQRRGPKPVLGTEIEAGLVEAILAFQYLGYGLGRTEIMNLAKQVDARNNSSAFGDKDPSDMRYKRFSERHEISLRTPRNLAKCRADMSTEEVRDDLFGNYRKLLERYNFSANEIFNMDESGLQIVTKPLRVAAKKGSKIIYNKQESERSQNISIVAAGNASGTIIVPPMVIFKSGYLTTKIKPDQFPPNCTFAVTDSGYMTCELFLRWFEIFLQSIPPKRPILLIMDGHVSHVSLDVVEMAKKNSVEVLILPPHTTYIFQPLDVSVFASLKEFFKQAVRTRMRKFRKGIQKYDFGKVFTPAYLRSMTPLNLIKGFKATGLWPENKFKADVKKKPPKESPSTSQTSSSDTSTTSESDSRPKYETVKDVISKFLTPSPQKNGPKTSRRIMVSRCLTNEEFRKVSKQLEEPKKKRKKSIDHDMELENFDDDFESGSSGEEEEETTTLVEEPPAQEMKRSRFDKKSVSEGDFVMVKFPTGGQSRDRYFIGSVQCINACSTDTIIALRVKKKCKPCPYLHDP